MTGNWLKPSPVSASTTAERVWSMSATGYSKVPNLDFLEVGAGSNVAEVRKNFPDTFLNLRVSPVTLNDLSENELRSLIDNLIIEGNNPTNNRYQYPASVSGIMSVTIRYAPS